MKSKFGEINSVVTKLVGDMKRVGLSARRLGSAAVKRKHLELATGVSLSAMTPRDITLMNAEFAQVASTDKLADRMVKMLTDQNGLALGCQVDLYEHGLQAASRCFDDLLEETKRLAAGGRLEGLTPSGLSADQEELVVVALLHDVGETLTPINHGEVAAAMLRPYISPRNYWMLMHHEIFQLFYYGEAAGVADHTLREELRESPHWDACERFCRDWDQIAFDGSYVTYELDFFMPMVHRVLSKPVYGHMGHKEEIINRLKAGMAAGYPTEVAE